MTAMVSSAGPSPTGRVFGDPDEWPDDEVISVSGHLPAEVVLAAYREGLFPMPAPRAPWPRLAWISPIRRGILPLDGLRVSRSLRKTMQRYRLTVDTDFAGVLAGCADRSRPHGWIDHYIAHTYARLFDAGIVHTVEARDAEGRLVGGLYGVQLGGLFAGESMFHDPDLGRDASKAALVGLVHVLTAGEPRHPTDRLLDVQWRTDHLATLGVVEIARDDYLRRLARARELPAVAWPTEIDVAAALAPYREGPQRP